MNEPVQKALEAIRKITDFTPRVALTLGSGLGNYANEVKVVCEVPYKDIPNFPVSTAPGHDGRFVFGYIYDTPVVCMKGRVHYYEGYSMDQVVMPARLMHALGAEILFLTNASGGLNPNYTVGSLVQLKDHISIFVPNPLIGPNDKEEGVRFPDMSEVYDKELRSIVQNAAKQNGFDLQDGVYAQLTGPSFEAPAEIQLLKGLGIDMVGMSTVVEAIVARHMGMRVTAISLISNMAAGISEVPLSSEDVNEQGKAAEPLFTKLVTDSIRQM